jgi:hypothetical protein
VSVRIIIISTISVIVQLALTILAWGDWNSFFAQPARAWLVIGSFLLLFVAWFSGSSGLSGGEKHSSAGKTILYGFGLVLLLLTLVPPYCDRHDIWVIDGDAVRYFGLFLFFAGSLLRLAAVFVLGRRFSGLVAIQPDHQLKTDGLYPLYSASKLRWTHRIDDRLGADFPQRHRIDLRHSSFPIPG